MTIANVIFNNLQNSGSSAIDPILREIFSRSQYFVTSYGPDGTDRLLTDLDSGDVRTPFYHWSHSPVSIFGPLVGDSNTKFIYLHRDPRDAAVSWSYLFKAKDIQFKKKTFLDVLDLVATHVQPPHLFYASEWLRTNALIIKFDEIKNSTGTVIFKILDHVGYFNSGNRGALKKAEIHGIIQKFSFEAIAGFARGASKYTVKFPPGYMLRTGTTGEWREHFSCKLLHHYDELVGHEVSELGYENAHTKTVNLASPMPSCGIYWLINSLVELNLRASNATFDGNQWVFDQSSKRWFLDTKAKRQLTCQLPALKNRDYFEFDEKINFRWKAELDLAVMGSRETLLLVRDPREIFYPAHLKNCGTDIEHREFSAQHEEWPEQFSSLFQLPPLETYAYFCWFWLAMGRIMPVKIIKFEDIQSAPGDALSELLSSFGIKRAKEQINRAVLRSNSEEAFQAMKTMWHKRCAKLGVSAEDQSGEWREAFSGVKKHPENKILEDLLYDLDYVQDCDDTIVDKRFSEDYNLEPIDADLKVCIQDLLSRFERGERPDSATFYKIIVEWDLVGEDLAKFALVCQAMFFCEKIFNDTASIATGAALRLFVNLNLSYQHESSLRALAQNCLAKIESDIFTAS